jgi:hypothetical protein
VELYLHSPTHLHRVVKNYTHGQLYLSLLINDGNSYVLDVTAQLSAKYHRMKTSETDQREC